MVDDIWKKIKKKLKNTISTSKHLKKTIHVKKINYKNYYDIEKNKEETEKYHKYIEAFKRNNIHIGEN